MNITGKIHAESPIYRGNGRKTMFTRDGDGIQKLVSLPGEIEGTAQSLMDAFIGQSKNGKNIGLLNRLWLRLFNEPMPRGLITNIECTLNKASYPFDHFFDLRMGMTLNEDRWAADANKNYKMETVLRDSVFDFKMTVSDDLPKKPDIYARLYYLLEEMTQGRFWFGAGKSKGLGRIRLELNSALPTPETAPTVNTKANHLRLTLRFDSQNPILVGWNWGKVEQEGSPSTPVDGKNLIGVLGLPDYLTQRLQKVLTGPILPEQWKSQLEKLFPRIIAIWLREQSKTEIESWTLPSDELAKLGKGKHALSAKLIDVLNPLTTQAFSSKEEAEAAIKHAMAKKPNMADRVIKNLQRSETTGMVLNQNAWQQLVQDLDLDESLDAVMAKNINEEAQLISALGAPCLPILDQCNVQIDRYVKMQQSDVWVDNEISQRHQHLKIKEMIRDGIINESQWYNSDQSPQGISEDAWREFLHTHEKVRFNHLTNQRNLAKSITNDQNMINFLKSFRARTRRELTKPAHIDFRAGGHNRNEISQKYGKPYDTIFMRMLVWKPGQTGDAWEAYIPGSTIKGAFRKRTSQVLRTLWGEGSKTVEMLNLLFGAQGQKGLVHFSDAYLVSADDASRSWCSMDGLKLNPKTGQPIESAKFDYLFAYGRDLVFRMRLDLLDISEYHQQALSLLAHIINDFKIGDVPLGGAKNTGMGWVQSNIEEIEWLTGNPVDIGRKLFNNMPMQKTGLWNQLKLNAVAAENAFQALEPISSRDNSGYKDLQRTSAGFISHRSFGGYSGRLEIEAKVLTPLHIRESGEPSFNQQSPDGNIYGWDFFSMAPPEKINRSEQKTYALPAKSLRGMLRHVYTVASDSHQNSVTINSLNPVDRLFGWVGTGPNQALMGRVSVGFAHFDTQNPVWYKVPFPYGEWQFSKGQWNQQAEAKAKAKARLVGDHWRMFLNYPQAPLIEQMEDFTPDTVQATYLRAMSCGDTARFTIRFWNLEEQELRRLLWCIQLDADMAHKIGKSRYLGFGSLSLRILPESFLIDWDSRYTLDNVGDAGRIPLNLKEWQRTDKEIFHLVALRQALNADFI